MALDEGGRRGGRLPGGAAVAAALRDPGLEIPDLCGSGDETSDGGAAAPGGRRVAYEESTLRRDGRQGSPAGSRRATMVVSMRLLFAFALIFARCGMAQSPSELEAVVATDLGSFRIEFAPD